MTHSEIDAVIDASDDDGDCAAGLADLLDDAGEWDWTDDSEHQPSDRLAVIESSGAWWLVYRGTEADRIDRFATHAQAVAALVSARDAG